MKYNIKYILYFFLIYIIYLKFKFKFKENYLQKQVILKKAIILIEFKQHPYFKKAIDNILKYKSKDWQLIVLTGKNIDTGLLPQNNVIYKKIQRNNITQLDYDKLLKTKEFWDKIDAEHIQIIKIDSTFCNKLKDLDDYIKFEYIGCSYPTTGWNNKSRGLGSFSLRKKSFMIDCINSYPDLVKTSYPKEDAFYSMCLVDKMNNNNYNDPTQLDINNYCVEHVFDKNQEAPLGMNVSYIKKETKDWLKKKCNIGKYLLSR
jgi:hypothetical protein